MKKQLLLVSMILFSGNASASITPETTGAIALHLGKGVVWSGLGGLIISSTALFRLTKILLKIDEKIKKEGEIKITKVHDLAQLIKDSNKASHSKLQRAVLFILSIPTAYCFAQSWNNYSSITNLIKHG